MASSMNFGGPGYLGPGAKYAALLKPTNTTTHAGGLAHVLQQLLLGYQIRKDRKLGEQEVARQREGTRQDDAAVSRAFSTMLGGVPAFTDPDSGVETVEAIPGGSREALAAVAASQGPGRLGGPARPGAINENMGRLTGLLTQPTEKFEPIYGPDGTTIIGQKSSTTNKAITDPRAPKDAKAPTLSTIYDELGREQKVKWNPTQGKYVPVGGPKASTTEGGGELTRAQRRTNEDIGTARVFVDRLRAEAGDEPITEALMRRITQTDPITNLPITDYSSFLAGIAKTAANQQYTLTTANGRDEQLVARRYGAVLTGLNPPAPSAPAMPAVPAATPAPAAQQDTGPGFFGRFSDYLLGESAATAPSSAAAAGVNLLEYPYQPGEGPATSRVLDRRRGELEGEALRLPAPSVNEQAAIREARRALQSNADPAAVDQRLRENGIDPRYLRDPRIDGGR